MGEIINVFKNKDDNAVYGYLIIHNVSRAEVWNEIRKIKNDKEFLENNPELSVDDIFANFPENWNWEFVPDDGSNNESCLLNFLLGKIIWI